MEPPATDVIGLKSVPRGDVTEVDVAVETATALGNNGRVGGIDAPDTGGCMPGGMPGIPGIMLQRNPKFVIALYSFRTSFVIFINLKTLDCIYLTCIKLISDI